ncbi:MAG: polysaccharide deacetylase family protein, partial [Candidatus Acidiferrum sp.]
MKDTNSRFVSSLRVFARRLCLPVFIAFVVSSATAQQRPQVAITVDDLPIHGDLPSTMTRTEIAKKMIEALKAKRVPGVYGFVNAKNIGGDAEKAGVLKMWADSGFALGSHTYSHIDLNASSVQAFE